MALGAYRAFHRKGETMLIGMIFRATIRAERRGQAVVRPKPRQPNYCSYCPVLVSRVSRVNYPRPQPQTTNDERTHPTRATLHFMFPPGSVPAIFPRNVSANRTATFVTKIGLGVRAEDITVCRVPDL